MYYRAIEYHGSGLSTVWKLSTTLPCSCSIPQRDGSLFDIFSPEMIPSGSNRSKSAVFCFLAFCLGALLQEKKVCEDWIVNNAMVVVKLLGATGMVLIINQILLFIYEYLVSFERPRADGHMCCMGQRVTH